MKKANKFILIFTIALLITGNLVGAGILGLPVNTGIDGLIPSLAAMFLFGGAMYYTALILARVTVAERQADFNYPSFYQRSLGKAGKWIAICANMLILYGLLTAYLTGATTIIARLFNVQSSTLWILLVIFVILTGTALLGVKAIQKYNMILMFLLWGSFAIIVFIGERHVEPVRLLHTDWGFLPVAVPIIVTSFHFHNIIPNVCASMKWDFKTIWKAMLFGMILGYIMNAIWIQVGVGCLELSGGKNSLVYAFEHNIPATVPMAQTIGSSLFTTCSMLFALLAITTSYIANAMGLIGFNTNLTNSFLKKQSRIFTIILTFLPPLIIAILFPNIFLKAINLVGGIGIVLLFGVLPCLYALLQAKKNKKQFFTALFFLILFSAVFIFQVSEELGIINLTPKVEHVGQNVSESGSQ